MSVDAESAQRVAERRRPPVQHGGDTPFVGTDRYAAAPGGRELARISPVGSHSATVRNPAKMFRR
jgi:hypothetical protein